MKYRATLNYDFSGKQDANSAARLKVALLYFGWVHVETSAFILDTTDITLAWRGIELAAKQASSIGALSAITFHIQASKDFSKNVGKKSKLNEHNAVEDILVKSFPAPRRRASRGVPAF